MKTYAQILVPVVSFALLGSAYAQHRTFTVDPAASQVDFALAGTGHHVQGIFKVQSGAIDFDPGAQTISGSIVVAAASGNSGEPSRDKKMNSEVLNTDQYAEISFAPKSYQGTLAPVGDSTIQVSGVFTLHGAPHNITVPMQIHIDSTNLTAKGQFVVPYVQWGLKDPSVFILKVAKEVQIDLNLAGHVTP
ncbi:MAG TPA: YceI family protein [Terracidiphilus sp.]|nr:YceI family protein [Terracidiphilus sp.]